MYLFRSKLVCLPKKGKVIIEKTLAYNEICQFSVNQQSLKFYGTGLRAQFDKTLFVVIYLLTWPLRLISNQGLLKGEVSLYHWPPVWLVYIYSVLQIKTKIVSSHIADSKLVKREVNGTMILPTLVFPVQINNCTKKKLIERISL